MFGFFIMGFVDIVGIATNYVKADFAGMDDKVASLISLSCFLWFLILSIPTGMLMNRIGRKKTVLLSFAVTAVAMLIPILKYDLSAFWSLSPCSVSATLYSRLRSIRSFQAWCPLTN